MATVSISKAAKLAGVSRSTLYSTYINKGVVSVSTDGRGRKCIDTSELLRVFGSLRSDGSQDTQPKTTTTEPDSPDIVQDKTPRTGSDSLELELKLVREQLADAKEQIQAFSDRESWYQSQVKTLTDTVKLLEDKRKPSTPPRRWWQFMWK
jgi:DNA-binding transcriptional MerR regulator